MIRTAFTLPRSVADDVEVWAIGDAHGCYAEACAVIDAIAATPRAAARRVLVTLGDAIDRGPNSLKTLDLWQNAAGRAEADELVSLMGNHEQMLRRGFGLPQDGPCDPNEQFTAHFLWARNGGSKVLDQLDINFGDIESLISALGPARIAYLRALKSHYRAGDRLFVHAGVAPHQPIASFLKKPWHEIPEDGAHWCWIREPFLNAAHEDGFEGSFVVHGHTTPGHEPFDLETQVRRFRLNLDFGSFKTGQIGFARFIGDQALVYRA
ncbi:MAG: metallophosphoesterase [Rhodoblastus sp.]|nr:metallophosphoesterase [Rhodoblastus sp.]